MRRSVLPWVLVAACWLGGTVLGVAGAALRTDEGRHIVVDWAMGVANQALGGTVSVGQVGGSFLRGLEVSDVVIRDTAGVDLLTVDRVGLRYGLGDLLRGRIVLGHLSVTRPHINLVQWRRGAPLNLDEVLPKGDGGGGPSALIAFNDVQIVDGTVTVRTPAGPGDTLVERERGPFGDVRVRRFRSLNARLGYLRVSSPLPGEDGIRAEVERLRVVGSDPVISVTDLRGWVTLVGDTLQLDGLRVRLPQSSGLVDGTLSWPYGPILFDLRVDAQHVVADEVRGLVSAIPAGLVGAGRFTVRSRGADELRFVGERLDLEGWGGGGRARGRLGMTLGPGETWSFDGTDLDLQDFDLEYVRGFLDTLPMAGRITGEVAADGPREGMQLELDVSFRDSLVEGWPESLIEGEGLVAVGVPGEFIFQRFAVTAADIDLSTVRRLVPAIELLGRLRGSGTLSGPWRNVTYEGELRYAHKPLPETVARGSVQLDSRGDTLGVWSDVVFDSLRLASFHSSYPGFDVVGSWAGALHLAGRFDSLALEADLSGPGGAVRLEGALLLLPDRRGAHVLTAELQAFDLGAAGEHLPATSLFGRLEGSGEERLDDGGFGLRARVSLDSSVIQGVSIDGAEVLISVADTLARVDTLRVWASNLEVEAAGSFGVDAPQTGTLRFVASADSIGALEPAVASWLGPLVAADSSHLPDGTARLVGELSGNVESYRLVGNVETGDLRRGPFYVSRLSGRANWTSASRILVFDGRADSLELGDFAFFDVETRLNGRPDSLHWQGRGAFGLDGAWLGGGQLFVDSASYTVAVDSLGVLLLSGPWFADTAAVVTVDSTGIELVDLTLRHAREAGSVAVEGRVALTGAGTLTGSVVALPLADAWLVFQQDYQQVGGELSGTFVMSGSVDAPIIDLSANLRNAVYGEFRAPFTNVIVGYRNQRLTGELELTRLAEPILHIEFSLPVDLALRGAEGRRVPGTIMIRALADSVDLALLERTTPVARNLGGTLDADFGITGTWEQPELTGQVALHDGAATLPALGVRYEALNGALALSADTISIQHLSLVSGGGMVAMRGFVRLEELSRPILNVDISSREFEAIDVRDFLSLTATSELELRGPFYNAMLTGNGTATGGVLYFEDLVRKDVVNLEAYAQDPELGSFADTLALLISRHGLGAPFESRFIDSLGIDSLQVLMGSDFRLRSSEANIPLEGSVFVSKLRDRYQLDGTLGASRGTYRLQLPLGSTREFNVTRGEVRYLGTPDLDADLDVEAEHVVRTTQGEEVTVFVHITGRLYQPQLTLTSDIQPAVSETEVISYLLFGAPSFQVAAQERGFGWRLGSQTLFGVVSSQLEYSLITDLGAPLDYFQIRPETGRQGLAGAELSAGKQFTVLGTTAFLTASPRICPRQQTFDVGASLEFRLTRRWLVAGSVDPLRSCEALTTQLPTRYQFGLDLFWETRY